MPDMDLTGKHLTAWMTVGTVLKDVLALIPTAEEQLDEVVAVGGTIRGVTSQLGIWLELRSILRSDFTELIPPLPGQVRTQLFRWDVIHHAVILDRQPTPEQEKAMVGFRPR